MNFVTGLLVVFIILIFLFFYSSNNLLLTLLILELVTFIIISLVLFFNRLRGIREFFILIMFTIFVLEGVIGLSGLIRVVYFTGKDYLSLIVFLV